MKNLAVLCVLIWMASVSSGAAAADNPRVALETSKGTIVIELFADKAPETVASFLDNVTTGFYDGTIFHRVVKEFMLQGGGHLPDGKLKPTDKSVANEADNGLKNLRGTVAMARKNDPHSASVQFFINHADNAFLDHASKTPQGWGYAVFGRVIEGMSVVDEIAGVTVRRTQLSEAQPLQNVLINRARLVQ